MRILLAHNSTYYPSQGGGDKSNRILMQALAARGHQARVVTRVETFGPEGERLFSAALAQRGISHVDGRFSLHGVDVHTRLQDPNLRAFLVTQIAVFDPDVILASTDDPGQLLLETALGAPRAKVIYLVRATIALPFGPDASARSVARAERLRQVDAVVGVSEYAARYVRQHGGMEAVHVPISLMEETVPPEMAGGFDKPFVTMVNPCAVKGIAIFLELADTLPLVQFAAVPTWGTTESDLQALRARPNVTLLERADDIGDILQATRILLVPSVWAEARGRIVVEAMARGVPVLASNTGGLPEAKMGVPYLLPVHPISKYHASLDGKMVPVAEAPAQDVSPWLGALQRLAGDRAHYEDIARQSRAAALHYIRDLSVEPLERLLFETPRKTRTAPAIAPERQQLLALRLKQKAWFPNCVSRTFCFPFAGGGTLWCRKWNVCAALLPGREARLEETPLESMDALVAALEPAIAPLLDSPYIFFGHSMGAGIAFELTHALLRAGRRAPSALLLSASKAPRLRKAAPPVSDEELMRELRLLGGIPEGADGDANWMRYIYPALRADALLYRAYAPAPRPPLAIPIFAYAGAADPRVRPEEVEAWRLETRGPFRLRLFPGGHFYFQDDGAAALLSAMDEDIASL